MPLKGYLGPFKDTNGAEILRVRIRYTIILNIQANMIELFARIRIFDFFATFVRQLQ